MSKQKVGRLYLLSGAGLQFLYFNDTLFISNKFIILRVELITLFVSNTLSTTSLFVISGFRRELDEKCALLGYCAASSGNFLPTFRDNLSVPSSIFLLFLLYLKDLLITISLFD